MLLSTLAELFYVVPISVRQDRLRISYVELSDENMQTITVDPKWIYSYVCLSTIYDWLSPYPLSILF